MGDKIMSIVSDIIFSEVAGKIAVGMVLALGAILIVAPVVKLLVKHS